MLQAGVRVFTKEDFKLIEDTVIEIGMTPEVLRKYKEMRLGQRVPLQTVSDEERANSGYGKKDPWIKNCLEWDLLNWD
jgi:hypothetical protein